MDMSKAALPPRSGYVSEADRKHPRYAGFVAYQNSCRRLMIDCSDFRDWLFATERQERDEDFARHPRFPEFQAWMRSNQGGARKCPAGSFPANFTYWLDGGRW